MGTSTEAMDGNPVTTTTKVMTESQHGRGGKGPLWVTQPNPLPKQGHPQQAAQHRVQAGLEYLQRRRTSMEAMDGNPVTTLRHTAAPGRGSAPATDTHGQAAGTGPSPGTALPGLPRGGS